MIAAYMDFIKRVQDASTGAPKTVLTYERVLGGSNRTLYFAVPFDRWSDRDGWMSVPEILTKA